MKQSSTIFLKIALFLMGAPVLALAVYGIFYLAGNPVEPEYASILYPAVVIMYVSVIPYCTALYQAFRILVLIDNNEGFSHISEDALNKIKYCAFAVSSLYIIMLPFVYFVAEKDDAPGLILFGMFPIFGSMVIAFFAAVLKRLLIEAIIIKSENEYTV
ncbi:DUF2975 domain-containing protein [Priestia aryabhattai]